MAVIRCKWCDWHTQAWYVNKQGKKVGPNTAYRRLSRHVEYEHREHNAEVRDGLAVWDEDHPDEAEPVEAFPVFTICHEE